jgi:hypothetical protein
MRRTRVRAHRRRTKSGRTVGVREHERRLADRGWLEEGKGYVLRDDGRLLVKVVPASSLDSSCWVVQLQGIGACEGCELLGSPECGASPLVREEHEKRWPERLKSKSKFKGRGQRRRKPGEQKSRISKSRTCPNKG